jgi:hypothetical protein
MPPGASDSPQSGRRDLNVPDRNDFTPCWPLLRRAFGGARPAATMLRCDLYDPRMKIEIEVYARRHR